MSACPEMDDRGRPTWDLGCSCHDEPMKFSDDVIQAWCGVCWGWLVRKRLVIAGATRRYTDIKDWHEAVYGPETGSYAPRRRPNVATRLHILQQQDGRCFYCGSRFGTYVTRKNRPRVLKAAWDHVIPYVYLQANPDTNWVAACQVCNGIKGSRIFATVDEAREHITRRRKRCGWGPVDTPPAEKAAREEAEAYDRHRAFISWAEQDRREESRYADEEPRP